MINTVQPYAWGSRTAIAELQGRPATDSPEAELWMGAHPTAPSTVLIDGYPRPLIELIADDPVGMLGADVVATFGPTLPFLMKVLAAQSPLSLQVHPTAEQARAGFADEQARGVPLGAAHRMYRDANHKPELVYALTPFRALCGFRPPAETLRALRELAAPGFGTVVDILATDDHGQGLSTAVRTILSADPAERAALLGEVVDAARAAPDGDFAPEYRMITELAATYPDDSGVLVALLMNYVELDPGQALYLGAGNLHAYLSGTAVEVMANSDNVLRGGLTGKHVDIPELMRITDFSPIDPPFVRPAGPGTVYPTPAGEFELHRIDLAPTATHQFTHHGPCVILLVDGHAVVRDHADETISLHPGESLFVPANSGSIRIVGSGTAFAVDVPEHGTGR